MSALTARGRGLLAVGLVGAGIGWGIGSSGLLAVAVLLITLPLAGMAIVRRSRFSLGSARSVEPARFCIGDSAAVELTIENASWLATGVLLLEDRVPTGLGEPARLLLDRVPAHAQRSETYRVVGTERGRMTIGPLSVTVMDPFGTAAQERSFVATNPVLVTPAIVSLGGAGRTMASGGRGETVFRSVSARGDDDVLPREHRAGDDMRRIHWRATARHGELMVRREEQAWHSSVLVVLDTRPAAHRGTGATSTFEWAVSAAASVTLHYLRRGWRVTATTTDGRLLADSSRTDLDQALHAFAEVRLGSASLMPALAADAEGASAVVEVLGRLTEDAADSLVRPTAGYAGCLLLDPGPAERLRSRGWRVACWTPSTPVADAWSHIAPLPSEADR